MTSDLIRMASVSLLLLLCTLCLAYGQSIKSINRTAVSHVVHSTIATNVIKPSVVKSSTMKPPSPIHSKTVSTPIKPPSSVHSVQPFASSIHTRSKSIQPSKSTSVSPSASPTVPPTTPPPKAKEFNVTNNNNTVCIRMKAIIEMTVTYFTKDKGTMKQHIHIDENTKNVFVNGTCNPNKRLMMILVQDQVALILKFSKVGAGLLRGPQQWKEDGIAAFVVTKTFPKSNGTEIEVKSNSSYFESGMNSYYKCDNGLPINLDKIKFDFSKLQVQPFADSSHEGFGEKGEICDEDKPTTKPTEGPDNDIVPIAVGCALAGLVVIVLIAYIIGRRRTHKGYQQV